LIPGIAVIGTVSALLIVVYIKKKKSDPPSTAYDAQTENENSSANLTKSNKKSKPSLLTTLFTKKNAPARQDSSVELLDVTTQENSEPSTPVTPTITDEMKEVPIEIVKENNEQLPEIAVDVVESITETKKENSTVENKPEIVNEQNDDIPDLPTEAFEESNIQTTCKNELA